MFGRKEDRLSAQKSENMACGANDRTCSEAVVNLAAEAWRFQSTAERAAARMDVLDAERFINSYRWYARKVDAVVEEAGLSVVDLTGKNYEVGMAVVPLNLEDFSEDELPRLRIAEMIEPVIMQGQTVRKTGTVMLEHHQS